MIPVALTIAGSDPSGGAGIQADLKTFHQLGVYGASAITLVTVQNTHGVSRFEILDASLVHDQIAAVLEDIPPNAIKTGARGDENVIRAIADCRFSCPLIVDPVMISKNGAPLLSPMARQTLSSHLLPCAALVTPNLDEAAALTGLPVRNITEMRQAALAIAALGARSVLVKGGHLEGPPVDLLYHQGSFTEFPAVRVPTTQTHGTGCTYSAAITALIARGHAIPDAVARAKTFISNAIRTAPGLGHGSGPLNHWADSL